MGGTPSGHLIYELDFLMGNIQLRLLLVKDQEKMKHGVEC